MQKFYDWIDSLPEWVFWFTMFFMAYGTSYVLVGGLQ